MRAPLAAALAALIVTTLAWSPRIEAKPPGPQGTFRSADGTVSLSYVGEGTVQVKLKTRYCALEADGGTFVYPQGIHVTNKKQEPLLIIFYQPRTIIVYATPQLKQAHCKGGLDVTGAYKRAGK